MEEVPSLNSSCFVQNIWPHIYLWVTPQTGARSADIRPATAIKVSELYV